MTSKRIILIGGVTIGALLLLIALTAILVPENVNPAYATAVGFVQAAATGEDAAAMAHLSDELRAYVAEQCPDGSVSACVQGYTPPEWGGLLSAVFRRAAPDGPAWNVDVIATYAQGVGFSGVCAFVRVEPVDEAWQVTRWAGFVHCGDPNSRNMAANPDAPNSAP